MVEYAYNHIGADRLSANLIARAVMDQFSIGAEEVLNATQQHLAQIIYKLTAPFHCHRYRIRQVLSCSIPMADVLFGGYGFRILTAQATTW